MLEGQDTEKKTSMRRCSKGVEMSLLKGREIKIHVNAWQSEQRVEKGGQNVPVLMFRILQDNSLQKRSWRLRSKGVKVGVCIKGECLGLMSL